MNITWHCAICDTDVHYVAHLDGTPVTLQPCGHKTQIVPRAELPPEETRCVAPPGTPN